MNINAREMASLFKRAVKSISFCCFPDSIISVVEHGFLLWILLRKTPSQ